jgi:putative transposase
VKSHRARGSRAGFYRSLQERQPIEEDMEVRSTIQLIFAEHKRRYGYPRVSKELRRRGMLVNRKRVHRLMREDNLLAVQPKAFVITTDSAVPKLCRNCIRSNGWGSCLSESRFPRLL